MIDLHAHIIYGVDDGPKTLEESLSLLKVAKDQGIRHIVATSHRRKGMFETPETTILTNFLTLNQAAKRYFPELTLSYGSELYYQPSLVQELERQEVPTLNGTRFVLIEFSSKTPYKDMQQAVKRLSLLGLTPILAHVERYDDLAFDDKRVADLVAMGAYTQVNSSSVLKPKLLGDTQKIPKKRAQFFLEKNLVHLIASDMHNLTNRPPLMLEAYQEVYNLYGPERAKALFISHPKALLENHYI